MSEVADVRLDLRRVRERALAEGRTLDQYNLQDVIRQQLRRADPRALSAAGDNRLFYSNPYVIHRPAANRTGAPVKRSFLRVLFTVDERDRLGDTVSPIIGPCYPFKVKTVADVRSFDGVRSGPGPAPPG